MKTVKQQTTKVKDYSPSATLGKNSKSETEGGDSPSAALGDYSKSYTEGYHSPSATLGFNSISRTKHLYSHSATFEYNSQSYTKGNRTFSITMGKYSLCSTEGENSIAIVLGRGSLVKAADGYIIIVEYDKKGDIKEIYKAKIGETILGVTIEPNKWYGFDDDRGFRTFTENEVSIFKIENKMIKEIEQ